MDSATPDEDSESGSPSLSDRKAALADALARILGDDVVDQDGEVVDGELTEDKREAIREIVEHHRGPLPPPSQLREYGEVVPGLDELIVRQWTEETAHRRTHENELRKAVVTGERLGQWLGFTLGLVTLAIAALAIVLDRTGIGVAALLTGGAVLVGTAIWKHHGGNGPPDET
ncbi:MAG: DUF2335 domain-containing protein [Solirubrobacteraceae bacterium]|nr:DUF2335 domain-containing protein [Solirubrobacteraceae bacterium]